MNNGQGLPPDWPRPGVPGSRGRAVANAPPAPQTSDPDFYRARLEDLRSGDSGHRWIAASQLANAQPTQLRAEIAEALAALVHDRDFTVQLHSLRALAVWATEAEAPAVIRVLKDSNPTIRDAAVAVLDKLRDPRIEPLVALLSDPFNHEAVQCLKHFGPPVEDALLSGFDAGNHYAQRAIIDILGTVATDKGTAKLHEIAENGDLRLAGPGDDGPGRMRRRGAGGGGAGGRNPREGNARGRRPARRRGRGTARSGPARLL